METIASSSPDYAAMRRQQLELAAQVVLEDAFARPPALLAGIDTGFESGDDITRSAAVLLDGSSLHPLDQRVARLPTALPYIPGLLSFRELPAALQALRQLPQVPQLVFVDGHGIAHPRGLGIASHLGVLASLPSIGVGKSRLVGEYDEPGPLPGEHAPLLFKGRQVGWVLRSKARCKPLFVSPGHRVSVESCLALVLDCLRGYRLPEPTRLADRLASRR